MPRPGEPHDTPAETAPSESVPSVGAVEHDFSMPADADYASGEDEAEPA